MGQKQSSTRLSVDVGDPLHVQHTAQLKLDPERGIVLQIPELDAFLTQEGIPYSDRATWDVMRFVYQAGGLELVKNTLQLVRERRVTEPLPDYDVTTSSTSRSSTTLSSPSSDRRRNWSSQEEEEAVLRTKDSSSDSARKSFRQSSSSAKRNSSRRLENSPQLKPQFPLSDAVSEVGEDWRSARSSMHETQEITIQWVRDSSSEEQPTDFIRPASKVWKRPMAPEVHADLVRVLKARESQDEHLKELQELEIRRTHTILITDPDMNG